MSRNRIRSSRSGFSKIPDVELVYKCEINAGSGVKCFSGRTLKEAVDKCREKYGTPRRISFLFYAAPYFHKELNNAPNVRTDPAASA